MVAPEKFASDLEDRKYLLFSTTPGVGGVVGKPNLAASSRTRLQVAPPVESIAITRKTLAALEGEAWVLRHRNG
jgi:hypothetical protein